MKNVDDIIYPLVEAYIETKKRDGKTRLKLPTCRYDFIRVISLVRPDIKAPESCFARCIQIARTNGILKMISRDNYRIL